MPAYAPTTSSQAAEWSTRYWPISYKNTNPYGPHPALVGRAEAELLGKAGNKVTEKMALASKVARAAEEAGLGIRAGCVVASSQSSGHDEIVAVAGDARWCLDPLDGTSLVRKCESGNVMAHAVMRAIAMIAKKRIQLDSSNGASGDRTILTVAPASSPYCDWPSTAVESNYWALQNIEPNGYLCLGLDISVTHEPCGMCAMAIVHSRFARCIFGKRMPLTGAFTADERGLGHGLFWRPAELNWKLLCWEWQCEDDETGQDGDILEHLNV